MVAVIRDQLIDGVTVIPCRLNGPRGIVKSILVHDDSSLVLIDTGFNEADATLISAALARLGRSPADLTSCVITHHHLDHVGGLPALRARASFPVVSHELEAEAIQK